MRTHGAARRLGPGGRGVVADVLVRVAVQGGGVEGGEAGAGLDGGISGWSGAWGGGGGGVAGEDEEEAEDEGCAGGVAGEADAGGGGVLDALGGVCVAGEGLLDLGGVGCVGDEDCGVGDLVFDEEREPGEEKFQVEVGAAHGKAAAVAVVDDNIRRFGRILDHPDAFEISSLLILRHLYLFQVDGTSS
ncbi:hypothetical protein FH972_026125 [Carpinus fangiana]|uniref:Uncharacterized protein n=1 Tax=Carpinus fangiana TaxID=176857 RepID=A0A5N6L3J2_9ROSI|nr:hypothetical protein FH972_026125 [Carpinus fangiana]